MVLTGQPTLQTLTAQWYNAVVAACKLNPETFQLVQSNQPLGATTESLWDIFDAVPPLSINHYFNPTQYNRFSSDYGAVINNLVPPDGYQFQKCMGDYYNLWWAYLKTKPTLPQASTFAASMLLLFQNWAAQKMPASMASNCYNSLAQDYQNPVTVAVEMWAAMVSAAAPYGGVSAYSGMITDVMNQLQSAPPVNFTFDSQTQSSDVAATWALGAVSEIPGFFGATVDAAATMAAQAEVSAGIVMEVSFDHLIQFPMAPLSQASSDPILGNYTPWFDLAALSLAYKTQDNTVWIAGSHPTWADTFGPTGNIQRVCESLVIVDGITITQQSDAGITQSEQEQFQAAAEVGFWPFFKAESQGGWSQRFNIGSQGDVSLQASCPVGNPNILGVNVLPIASFVSS